MTDIEKVERLQSTMQKCMDTINRIQHQCKHKRTKVWNGPRYPGSTEWVGNCTCRDCGFGMSCWGGGFLPDGVTLETLSNPNYGGVTKYYDGDVEVGK